MGTEYSRTMPGTMFGSEKRSPPSTQPISGMSTCEIAMATSMGAGRLKVRARLKKLLPREPWKVTKANMGVTRGLRTANASGAQTPNTRQRGTRNTMLWAMMSPRRLHTATQPSSLPAKPACLPAKTLNRLGSVCFLVASGRCAAAIMRKNNMRIGVLRYVRRCA